MRQRRTLRQLTLHRHRRTLRLLPGRARSRRTPRPRTRTPARLRQAWAIASPVMPPQPTALLRTLTSAGRVSPPRSTRLRRTSRRRRRDIALAGVSPLCRSLSLCQSTASSTAQRRPAARGQALRPRDRHHRLRRRVRAILRPGHTQRHHISRSMLRRRRKNRAAAERGGDLSRVGGLTHHRRPRRTKTCPAVIEGW